MERFCKVMVVVYIILFIPASIYSAMFQSFSVVGSENANGFLVGLTGFLMQAFPVIIFGSAAFGYAMNRDEKYDISRIILCVPIVVLIIMWIAIWMA